MKKLFMPFVWTLIVLLSGLSIENLSAQELTVISFEAQPNDVVARSQPVLDKNRNPCAMLRVILPAEGVDIRGNMGRVGDIKNPRASEYIAYFPAGTKRIYINCPGCMPLTYDIGYGLEGKMVYRFTLERPQLFAGPAKPQIKTQYVRIDIQTPGATVLIDGIAQPMSDGIYIGKFELGTHSYYISAPQHYPEEGEFSLSASGRTDLKVTLKPNYGYLDVESTPDDARVMIDGEEMGKTPCKIKLGCGDHTVQLIHSGYFVFDKSVTITSETTQSLKASLKESFAQITLKAPYAHSEIWVNNQFKGKGEWTGRLDSNIYEVETRTEGYETISENVEVDAGVSRTVILQTPAPIYGLLEIISNPFDATILIDGQEVGTTPWQSNEVLVGKHTLTIQKENFRHYNKEFTLTQEKPVIIEAILDSSATEISTPASTEIPEVRTAEVLDKSTYKIGDYYHQNGKEGVVFWVDATGKHGKIISLKESSLGLQWTSNEQEQKLLIGADSKNDGKKNMAEVKQCYDWREKYPAFAWCADLGDGWYLPAIDELMFFTLNKEIHDAINRTLAQHGGNLLAKNGKPHSYWSSTEVSHKNSSGEYYARYVHMGDGYVYRSNKLNLCRVRAVYAF